MKCPKCKRGILEERIEVKSEPDSPRSVIFGTAFNVRFFPMIRYECYPYYLCNRCGYEEKKE